MCGKHTWRALRTTATPVFRKCPLRAVIPTNLTLRLRQHMRMCVGVLRVCVCVCVCVWVLVFWALRALTGCRILLATDDSLLFSPSRLDDTT
jgi:hypothetical protein